MLAEELIPYRKFLINAGLRESQALVREMEGDPRAELQRVHAYAAMARLQKDAGDVAEAAATARRAIGAAEAMVARDPADLRGERLAWILHRAVAVLEDPREREAVAERANAIVASLPPASVTDADEEMGDPRMLRAMNLHNASVRHLHGGRSREAIACLLPALADCRDVIGRGDRGRGVRGLEGRILLSLCRAYRDGQLDKAVSTGEEAEAIFQSLVGEHPDSFDLCEQLFLAREELAMTLGDADRRDEAIRAYQKARATLKDMAARHGKLASRMIKIQGLTAEIDFNLIMIYDEDAAKYAAARRAAAIEAYEIGDKLSLVVPLTWNMEVIHAVTAYALADYQAQDGLRPDIELLFKAERIWNERLRRDPRDSWARTYQVMVRRRLAEELEFRGRLAEALDRSRRWLDTARGDPEALYSLARTYAMDAGSVARTVNDDRQRERRRRSVADSIALLRQAVADGFQDVDRVRGDSVLEPLRADPAYVAILADLEFPANPLAPEGSGWAEVPRREAR